MSTINLATRVVSPLPLTGRVASEILLTFAAISVLIVDLGLPISTMRSLLATLAGEILCTLNEEELAYV